MRHFCNASLKPNMKLIKNVFGVSVGCQRDSKQSWKILADFFHKGLSLMAILSCLSCHCYSFTDFQTCTFSPFPLCQSCCLSDLEVSWWRKISWQKLIKNQSYGESHKFYDSLAPWASLPRGLIELQNSLAWKKPLKVGWSSLFARDAIDHVYFSSCHSLREDDRVCLCYPILFQGPWPSVFHAY